jgi:hypothetical protein
VREAALADLLRVHEWAYVQHVRDRVRALTLTAPEAGKTTASKPSAGQGRKEERGQKGEGRALELRHGAALFFSPLLDLSLLVGSILAVAVPCLYVCSEWRGRWRSPIIRQCGSPIVGQRHALAWR